MSDKPKAYQGDEQGTGYTEWAAEANREIQENMPPAGESSDSQGGDGSTKAHP
ncbi:hypothetical protein ACFPZ0_04710 [Streptomonospora nanhaiensis]|uniref:Uncharacterized protein n=1 Tax=Streptomonospora nanhaiensis TaxID=1323731 RepID=A0A853BSH8_9ACTN|nr:hypothetical protein [Streptomonospora nanhaiensis]MBV2365188.1 hypothetical protein [Streptomonospora nanhaiensis]MBX9387399.1 hypothetical protein [Streptomonospora nanhaiensis]NYI97461.1 hypothetical protein [Streptomonospora nanhaiensis]